MHTVVDCMHPYFMHVHVYCRSNAKLRGERRWGCAPATTYYTCSVQQVRFPVRTCMYVCMYGAKLNCYCARSCCFLFLSDVSCTPPKALRLHQFLIIFSSANPVRRQKKKSKHGQEGAYKCHRQYLLLLY